MAKRVNTQKEYYNSETIIFYIFNDMDTNNVLSQIGNTPLIKLKQPSELTGCNIYGKANILILESQ